MKTLKPIFVLAIFAASLLSSCAQSDKQTSKVTDASVESFEKGIKSNPDAVILAVRTPEEYNEGHIKGAININYYSDDFAEQVNSKIDKNKPVYVYCKAGSRSAKSCEIMKDVGFLNLTNLDNGFDSWKKANKEIQK